MEYDSVKVMAYVMAYCDTNEPRIDYNKTKLQKLLYCCYGVVLARFDKRLTDERPGALPFGPVFMRTLRLLTDGELQAHERTWAIDALRMIDAKYLDVIDKTLEYFGKFTPPTLAKWSQEKDSPWDKASPMESLDDREIAKYFSKYVDEILGKAK